MGIMKKTLLTISIYFIIISLSNAQSHIGIKGGRSFSRVYFVPFKKQEFIQSNTAGIVFKHFSIPHFGIQLEINYLQKGWKEIIQNADSTYSRKLDYLEMPFLSHLYIGKGKTKAFLTIGPYIAYSLSGTEERNKNDILTSNDYSFPDTTYRFNFGVMGGLGINYEFKFGTLQFEARFSQSLRNVFKPRDAISRDRDIALSQMMTFSLSYFLPGKKNKEPELIIDD
jgi:hypothetical protein